MRVNNWVFSALSVASIADAANCIRLGHADWIFPAALAFLMAMMIERGVRA